MLSGFLAWSFHKEASHCLPRVGRSRVVPRRLHRSLWPCEGPSALPGPSGVFQIQTNVRPESHRVRERSQRERESSSRGSSFEANRASQLDDGEGATSRWCSKICARRATEREEQGPVVVLGGAEHGPPFHKFMKARINVEVTCIYEDLHGKHTTQQISSQLDTLNSEETRHSLQTLRSR